MDRDRAQRLCANVQEILGRMGDAAARSGRHPQSVTLVAITKYVGAEFVPQLVAAGCTEIGESRPQELWEKAALITNAAVHWHLVGHLQRNKVERTVPLVSMIHSVDSPRLLAALNRAASGLSQPLPILLEVNTSGEVEKHGWPASELPGVVESLGTCPRLEVQGLMTMAARTGGLAGARRNFAALRELRDQLQPRCPAGTELRHLSMGMSADFEVAIEEGATIVRVGSALFEGCLD